MRRFKKSKMLGKGGEEAAVVALVLFLFQSMGLENVDKTVLNSAVVIVVFLLGAAKNWIKNRKK